MIHLERPIKKIIGIILLLAFMSASFVGAKESPTSDSGGQNACQYVRELSSGQANDIRSVEVMQVDSLLSDRMPALNQAQLAIAGADYSIGKKTSDAYRTIIEDYLRSITDIMDSWEYAAKNDSLKRLEKYRYNFRRVYSIRVTMKSGKTYDYRILTDKGGETPVGTQEEFFESLQSYMDLISEANRNLYY